ncbi:hypothetical protein [Bacillus sp. E214]|uniref:hypothetical protein n=1 Tax=Bacillus sp. E214 TaxID=2587156 RepID=UPI001651DE52|nr:hypothetical protein [Bacillus sp. E214]
MLQSKWDNLQKNNREKEVIGMSIGILALVTMTIWIIQINELNKPEEKQDNRKTIILTSCGCLLTTVLTVHLFQNFIA